MVGCPQTRYAGMVSGGEPLESSLHVRLFEHVNSEAALGTLSDLAVAVQWARSTFLYVRAMRAPRRYLGLPPGAPPQHAEKKIEELCLKAMNALARAGMLTLDDAFCVQSTEAGKLMAIYCLDFVTMKLIMQIKGTETINEMLQLVCSCHELSDIPLRMGEKRCLNMLNRSKNSETIKYPIKGKISSKEMKVNCIIQAVLGCIPIHDPSLNQESLKIKRIASRIAKCIMAYITRNSFIKSCPPFHTAILNSLLLYQSLDAGLWNDSKFVSRQMKGIGSTLMTLLASAGKTSFKSIYESNPRDLERIMNKAPPAGNVLKEQVGHLPSYSLTIKELDAERVEIILTLENYEELSLSHNLTAGDYHKFNLIVGDSKNNLLHFSSHKDIQLIEEYGGKLSQTVKLKILNNSSVYAHCISSNWVGLNAECSLKVITDSESIPRKGIKRFLKTYVSQTKNEDKSTHSEITDVISNSQEPTSPMSTAYPVANRKNKTASKRIDEMFKEQKKRNVTNNKSKSPSKKVKLSSADSIIKDCIQKMIVIDEGGANLEHKALESQDGNNLSSINKKALDRFAYSSRICDKLMVDGQNKFNENILQHKNNDVWTNISSSYDDWLKTLNIDNNANVCITEENDILTEIEKEMQQRPIVERLLPIPENILRNNSQRKKTLDNFTERQKMQNKQYIQRERDNLECKSKSLTSVNQKKCSIANSIALAASKFNDSFHNADFACATQNIPTSNLRQFENAEKYSQSSSLVDDDLILFNEAMQEIIPTQNPVHINDCKYSLNDKENASWHQVFDGNLLNDEYDNTTCLFNEIMADTQDNCSAISKPNEDISHLNIEFDLSERKLLWKNDANHDDKEISNLKQLFNNENFTNTQNDLTILLESENSDKNSLSKFDKHFDLDYILGNNSLPSSNDMTLNECEKTSLNKLDRTTVLKNVEKNSQKDIVESTTHHRNLTQTNLDKAETSLIRNSQENIIESTITNRKHPHIQTVSDSTPNYNDFTDYPTNERRSDFVSAKHMVKRNNVIQINHVNYNTDLSKCDKNCVIDRVKYNSNNTEYSKRSECKEYTTRDEDSSKECLNKDKYFKTVQNKFIPPFKYLEQPSVMNNSITMMQTPIAEVMSEPQTLGTTPFQEQQYDNVSNGHGNFNSDTAIMKNSAGASVSVYNILNNLPTTLNICNETNKFNFDVKDLSPKVQFLDHRMKSLNAESNIVNNLIMNPATITPDESSTENFIQTNTTNSIKKCIAVADADINIVNNTKIDASRSTANEFTQKSSLGVKTNIVSKTQIDTTRSIKENSVSRNTSVFMQKNKTTSPPYHPKENDDTKKSNYDLKDTEFEMKIMQLQVIGKQTGKQFSMSVKSCSKKVSWRHPLTSNTTYSAPQTSEETNIQTIVSVGDLGQSTSNFSTGNTELDINNFCCNYSSENEMHNLFNGNGKILQEMKHSTDTHGHKSDKINEVTTESNHSLLDDRHIICSKSNIKEKFEKKKMPNKECSKVNSEKLVSSWLNKLTSEHKIYPAIVNNFCEKDYVQSDEKEAISENIEKCCEDFISSENGETKVNSFTPHTIKVSHPVENTEFRLKLSKILQENNPAYKKSEVFSAPDDNFDLGIEELFKSFMNDDEAEIISKDNNVKASFKKPPRRRKETIQNIEHTTVAENFLDKFRDNNYLITQNSIQSKDEVGGFSFNNNNPCDIIEETFSHNFNVVDYDNISASMEFPVSFCDHNSQESNTYFSEICDKNMYTNRLELSQENPVTNDTFYSLLNPQVVLESAYGSRTNIEDNIETPCFSELYSSHSNLLHTMADEVMCNRSINHLNVDSFQNADDENVSHWDKFMTNEEDSMIQEVSTTIANDENEDPGQYDCLVPSPSTCELNNYEHYCEKNQNTVNREPNKFQEIQYNSMCETLFDNENHSPHLNQACSAEVKDGTDIFSSPTQRLRKFQLLAKDKMSHQTKSVRRSMVPQESHKFVTSKMQRYLNAMRQFY